ncbi:hypothetical protein C9374_007179 [Naegleria lovaniensis]|uniref:Golgin-84 n=1 Tax=Naegleria lovaniensis TaxID=51637 RepID=A0AA88GZ12_NAELO|nr:uncharacterized protein C9374_007179 [Naegleria lovaniensis]KAG2393648.1 hypothetical protein C9374_007179 [Naegleria lovaniensis]
MWANSVLKWAEQTLENVDGASRKIAEKVQQQPLVMPSKISKKDDRMQSRSPMDGDGGLETMTTGEDNALMMKRSASRMVLDEEIKKETEKTMQEFYEKSEEERLKEAIEHAQINKQQPSDVNSSNSVDDENINNTNNSNDETSIIHDAETLPRDKLLEKTILKLFEEIKQTTKSNQLLSQKYEKLNSVSKHSQRYNEESQTRLEEQVARLLEEKVKTDTELTNALNEREKQAQKYQSRIESLIEQLKSKDTLISEMQVEKDAIANEQLRYEKSTADEISNLKQQIEDLQDETKELKKEEKKHLKRIEDLESQHQENVQKLKEEYNELENSLNDKLDEISRLESTIKLKEHEWQAKNQEFMEYKNRATKLLALRDKQIEELKKSGTESQSSGAKEPTVTADDDSDLMNALDKEDMMIDLENVKAENQELLSQIELMKKQHEAEINSLRFKLKTLEKNLEKEKQTNGVLQETITSLKMNFEETKHQYENEKKSIKDQLKEKKEEINQLQKQLNQAKYNNSSNQNELELRNRGMAERLIEKQTQLETLNSEKAAIQLALEKSQLKIKELQLMAQVTPMSRHSHYDEESPYDNDVIHSSVSMKTDRFFQDLSKRGFVASRVANAMAIIDSFSISTGSILRKLPLLRVFVVVYVILLHLWVVYILSHLTH